MLFGGLLDEEIELSSGIDIWGCLLIGLLRICSKEGSLSRLRFFWTFVYFSIYGSLFALICWMSVVFSCWTDCIPDDFKKKLATYSFYGILWNWSNYVNFYFFSIGIYSAIWLSSYSLCSIKLMLTILGLTFPMFTVLVFGTSRILLLTTGTFWGRDS